MARIALHSPRCKPSQLWSCVDVAEAPSLVTANVFSYHLTSGLLFQNARSSACPLLWSSAVIFAVEKYWAVVDLWIMIAPSYSLCSLVFVLHSLKWSAPQSRQPRVLLPKAQLPGRHEAQCQRLPDLPTRGKKTRKNAERKKRAEVIFTALKAV